MIQRKDFDETKRLNRVLNCNKFYYLEFHLSNYIKAWENIYVWRK